MTGYARYLGFSDLCRRREVFSIWLAPRLKHQNVVALCGLGGMGKTQLSIHFTGRFVDTYSSILRFNPPE